MIKRNNKKGFTIVELVIVIAVIAILAAVLIPTFSGIIKKAQESSDVQLAKNFNTALAAEEAATGKKPATFAAVLKVLAESGYNIEKLNPTADGNWFAWDEVTNQILYLDAEYNIISSAKDLDASSDSIDEGKWHFAVSDAEAFATVGAKTSNVYFVGMAIEKGDNVNLDLSGVTLAQNASTATPINVTGGTLNIKGGTVSATGEVPGADGKTYDISIEVADGVLNLTDTVVSGKTADGKSIEPISFSGGNGTLNNVKIDSDGGTPMGVYAGSNVEIINGQHTVKNYHWGGLFVSGNGNNTGAPTTATVKNTTFHIDFGTRANNGTKDFLFTVYGSNDGAALNLDGATVTYTESSDLSAFFQVHGKYSITIKNTTFNGKTLTLKDWQTQGYNATEVDGAIVITN